MSGFAGLVLSLVWALAPDGYLLARQLEGSELAPALVRLRPAAAGSWLVFHRRPSWAMAFYSPPEADLGSVERVAEQALLEPERLLPGFELPRIFLFAPYYGTRGELADLAAVSIDVAENVYHVLLEAYLDRELRDPASAYLGLARQRAAAVMAEVPELQRLAAYLAAAGDFGSHLLSVAHEIARAERRARARGEDLCALLDPPRTLFGLWAASVERLSYRGRYTVLSAGEEGVGGRQVTTRRGLEQRDKELFLEHVLGGVWTGDPVVDFGHLCRVALPAAGTQPEVGGAPSSPSTWKSCPTGGSPRSPACRRVTSGSSSSRSAGACGRPANPA